MTDTPVIDFEYSAQYRITNPKPLVTALINNYNYGRFLAEAIDSALAQTWQNLEVLVVDDGSTDNSREVLERYDDKIRVIYKENGGQASAFNAGIREAKGEILCFLDSDDIWHSNKVEQVVAKYQEGHFGLVCHDLYEVDANRNRVNEFLQSQTNNTPLCSGNLLKVLQKTIKWMFSATSGMSLPTKLALEIIPLPENDWRISADAPLALASICHAPAGVIQEALGEYRLHGKNGYASIKKDLNKIRLQVLIDDAKKYIFLKEYLLKINRIVDIKNPKEDYHYYRKLCFITKELPLYNLVNIWIKNIITTIENPTKRPLTYIKSFSYLISDTLLAFLIQIHAPNPYKKPRNEFKNLDFKKPLKDYLNP